MDIDMVTPGASSAPSYTPTPGMHPHLSHIGALSPPMSPMAMMEPRDTADDESASFSASASTSASSSTSSSTTAAALQLLARVPIPPPGAPDYPVYMVPADGLPFSTETEALRAGRVARFYTRNLLLRRVIPVVAHHKSTKYVAREIVWAVTNYFREKGIHVKVKNEACPVKLAETYDAWRGHYSKEDFDPYARQKKGTPVRKMVVLCAQDPEFRFETTVGQMLFYEYCVQYGVFDFMDAHHEEIRQHHREKLQQREREKREMELAGLPYKRRPLCEEYKPNACNFFSGQVVLHP